ncbi:MAG: RuBisCO large subunit C-terminal-like domain-containing protein [Planctomycetaceae bacterium]
MPSIIVTYRLACGVDQIESLSQDIALEQTVEVPDQLVTCPRIRHEIVGKVLEVMPVPGVDGQFDVRIAFAEELAANHLAQLLNLLFGNISLKRNIRLKDVRWPAEYINRFRGPNFGIDGLRSALGVFGRPLLATALKPKGSSPEHLARLARDFAAGGGDLVKDDHNLVESDFDAFQQRVKQCQTAVRYGSEQSGRPCWYLPNLAASGKELERRIEFLLKIGIRGALVAPMLLGLDQLRELAQTYPLFFLAHPTFTGTFFHDPAHGIDPGLLLGSLFRLAGCDGTIFPNQGGRFAFTDAECLQIADHARQPLGNIAPGWPAPAGGMSFSSLPAMCQSYSADAIYLIGGALLSDSQDLAASTGRFLQQILAHFPDHEHRAPHTLMSACELPLPPGAHALLNHLPFRPEFQWDGRPVSEYKLNGTLPFRNVTRTELIGTSGEQTAFDVRYFEIGPGGHSSLEKHLHTHVVIGARGAGILASGERTIPLKPFDLAYVPPLETHQLRNDSSEPFGFFCIVDHERDKPQAPVTSYGGIVALGRGPLRISEAVGFPWPHAALPRLWNLPTEGPPR